jgi:peptide-methionine (R)-S-oxide reductase
MHRRLFLLAVLAAPMARAETFDETFELTLTEAEWRARLSDTAYQVLREEATERPNTSPLNLETHAGTYHCAGCDLPVFSSKTKYDSGTGWPSFWDPLPDAIRTREDGGFFGARTEVHCRRCGGHFGHVFDDGPQPTGLRYCMNGAALTFKLA